MNSCFEHQPSYAPDIYSAVNQMNVKYVHLVSQSKVPGNILGTLKKARGKNDISRKVLHIPLGV